MEKAYELECSNVGERGELDSKRMEEKTLIIHLNQRYDLWCVGKIMASKSYKFHQVMNSIEEIEDASRAIGKDRYFRVKYYYITKRWNFRRVS